ncbi:AAA family ATPase [Micromonospora tulbaghiae]|uniref:AAA family ATPase n=1 Tax=Micromonospora tulbaghiae TaxID=479978 RepID=UPI00340E156C
MGRYKVKFQVLPARSSPAGFPGEAFLVSDNWNDWFRYWTTYWLYFTTSEGVTVHIGQVKIGQYGMSPERSIPQLPDHFERLGDEFFSLGQDDSYYEELNRLGAGERDQLLTALRDVAYNQELFSEARNEEVMGMSLLRFVSPETVQGRFKRLARGDATLSRFSFYYQTPVQSASAIKPLTLNFEVLPDSEPPSNIQVLIGTNGVGKTRLLHHMTLAATSEAWPNPETGVFGNVGANDGRATFSGLVSVSFSAFDSFKPAPDRRNKSQGTSYTYVGLKRNQQPPSVGDDLATPAQSQGVKSDEDLAAEFANSLELCVQGSRTDRWKRAVRALQADPIFAESELLDLVDSEGARQDLKQEAVLRFQRLSSGHKIALLMITRLVESVEERTLVLLDEPEAHLHPPLLSAFIRSLSDLLIHRNGVAIVATHSPVVLQEVPSNCVFKLRRSGQELAADQPTIETFGENVGILTKEVFGLEVTRSGFHRLISEAVNQSQSYEEVVGRFGNRLGGEARAIVQALLADREED